ncbi:TetR/AcrR family transcriptional regulator [Peribacillus saganii]|uniref:TetR/AcrR family transcriptional regulator n=1 Tax=Peribacillus saganii TaxID=2303992 RepID=UPI001314E28B|nr:TetR/AcrR family transcriptional regulator [Peribacillus saganii]
MEDKKLEVIRIAISLFAEKGYNYTSVEEIAKESGMAKGSFYKYFQSKEDLLLQTVEIISNQIEKGITKIYSKQYPSDHEKLVDFISMTIETMLSNQVHLLMAMIFDPPLIKNKEIANNIERSKIKLNIWFKDFLLDLCSSKAEEYVWDLTSLLQGHMFQYFHMCRYYESGVEPKKLAEFLATVLDIVIEGLAERKPESVFTFELLNADMQFQSQSPRLKGQKIQHLLRDMEYTVKSLKIDLEEQEEYLKTIALLRDENNQKKSQTFLLKALINYLQEVPEIREDCESLKTLLDIK